MDCITKIFCYWNIIYNVYRMYVCFCPFQWVAFHLSAFLSNCPSISSYVCLPVNVNVNVIIFQSKSSSCQSNSCLSISPSACPSNSVSIQPPIERQKDIKIDRWIDWKMVKKITWQMDGYIFPSFKLSIQFVYLSMSISQFVFVFNLYRFVTHISISLHM